MLPVKQGDVDMLKRAEILAATKRVARRLASNETGVAPLKDKHIRRLAELKRKEEEKRKARRATVGDRS
jgi:hypothetical protein